MQLEMSSQLTMYGLDANITPVVFTIKLEILFNPSLTTKKDP